MNQEEELKREEALVEEQFKSLPEALQKAINDVPWRSMVKEIALLNNVPVKQVPIVDSETLLVLYGMEKPENYIDNLMREAELSEEVARKIAEEVNEKIMKEIATKADSYEKGYVPKVEGEQL